MLKCPHCLNQPQYFHEVVPGHTNSVTPQLEYIETVLEGETIYTCPKCGTVATDIDNTEEEFQKTLKELTNEER
jgi:uncharacterized Zn finger protein